jgi:hypothetical protein
LQFIPSAVPSDAYGAGDHDNLGTCLRFAEKSASDST